MARSGRDRNRPAADGVERCIDRSGSTRPARSAESSTAAPPNRPCARSASARSARSNRVADRGRADPEPGRQPEELLAVGPGVGGDAAQPALLEQLAVVVQRRDVGQPDPGDGERAAAVERPQRDRHQLAGRGEQDRAVERLGRRVGRVADRVGAELDGPARRLRSPRVSTCTRMPSCQRELRGRGGRCRRSRRCRAGRRAARAAAPQRPVADDPGAQQRRRLLVVDRRPAAGRRTPRRPGRRRRSRRRRPSR